MDEGEPLGQPVDLSEHLAFHRATNLEKAEESRQHELTDIIESRSPEHHGGRTPSELSECPLVFVPRRAKIALEATPHAEFDWSGTQACSGTDWPTAQTPWLVFDRNGDGTIDSGAELFGTGVILDTGVRAQHGFEALAELDEDLDGKLTPKDAAWSSLMLWADIDRDRVSDADELTSLESHGLSALDLEFARSFQCDEAGNCAGERSTVTADGRPAGHLVDVYLRCR